jgi:hypothetical protein
LRRLPTFGFFQHTGARGDFHQRQHPPVGHALSDEGGHAVAQNRVAVILEVGVLHPIMAGLEQRAHEPQGVLGSAAGSQAVAVPVEFRL